MKLSRKLMTALNIVPVPGDRLRVVPSCASDHIDGRGCPLLDAPLLEEDGGVDEQLGHSADHGEGGVLGSDFTDFCCSEPNLMIAISHGLHIQESAKRLWPGCVNAAGKLRQKR